MLLQQSDLTIKKNCMTKYFAEYCKHIKDKHTAIFEVTFVTPKGSSTYYTY
jgi:hypothetical protein